MEMNNDLKAQREATQLRLFEAGQEERILQETERVAGVFTGERLQKFQPERYTQLLELLAYDVLSDRQVAALLHMSTNLVSVVRREHQDSVEAMRKRLAGDFMHIVRKASERVLEMLNDPTTVIPLRDLTALMDKIFEKAQLASGEPTSLAGSAEEREPSQEDYAAMLAGLQDAHERTHSKAKKDAPENITAQVETKPAERLLPPRRGGQDIQGADVPGEPGKANLGHPGAPHSP